MSVRTAAGLPDAGEGMCCWGATQNPECCTCWEPIHDQPQMPPLLDAPTTRAARMCADCAYRPGSPERTTDRMSVPPPPGSGTPFYCHQGMRLIIAHAHPAGIRVPAQLVQGAPTEWDPPIHDGRPYKADGRPAELCAGWAAAERRAARIGGDA